MHENDALSTSRAFCSNINVNRKSKDEGENARGVGLITKMKKKKLCSIQ